jgi:uracil-DNA glycosylase family 4
MRTVLTALTDELRRLKSAGVDSVSVSDESLAGLRAAVARVAARRPARTPKAPADRPAQAAASQPEVPPPVVSLPEGDKSERWNYLRDKVLKDPICLSHVRPGCRVVLGVGDLDASIFFVGEAPGAEEEVQGEPFVGPAGQLLTKMIIAMGLSRERVYIGNIMNWRPELPIGPDGVQYGNRPPTAVEMGYCLPYLRAQIEVVRPKILVALGTTAALGLLGPGAFKALGEVRGKWAGNSLACPLW